MNLSRRELEALKLAANGHLCPAMARIMGLSQDTVRQYRQGAMRKLGASSMPHAVALAFVDGVLCVADVGAV